MIKSLTFYVVVQDLVLASTLLTHRRELPFSSGFSSHNIPLLWGRDNYLGLRDFGLRELHIT